MTELGLLVDIAAKVTGRAGHDLYPEMCFGHLARERFDALVTLLEARPDEVTLLVDGADRTYLRVVARRNGVYFRAQTDVPEPALMVDADFDDTAEVKP